MGAAALGARGGCGFPRWASRRTSPHMIPAATTMHRIRLMSASLASLAYLSRRRASFLSSQLVVDGFDKHVRRPLTTVRAVLAAVSERRIRRLHLRERHALLDQIQHPIPD